MDLGTADRGLRTSLARHRLRPARPGRIRDRRLRLRTRTPRRGHRRSSRPSRRPAGRCSSAGRSACSTCSPTFMRAATPASPVWCWSTIRWARNRRRRRRAASQPPRKTGPARDRNGPVRAQHVPSAAERGLSGAVGPGHACDPGAGQPRTARLPGAADLLAGGGLFDRQAGSLCRAPASGGPGAPTSRSIIRGPKR